MAHHIIHWQEHGHPRSARWVSSRHPQPTTITVVADDLSADHALRLTQHNHAILWRGDYRNARQLLAAMARRLDRKSARHNGTPTDFHHHRQSATHRAQLLNRILVELSPDHTLNLPHAPAISDAYRQAHNPPTDHHNPPRPPTTTHRHDEAPVSTWNRHYVPRSPTTPHRHDEAPVSTRDHHNLPWSSTAPHRYDEAPASSCDRHNPPRSSTTPHEHDQAPASTCDHLGASRTPVTPLDTPPLAFGMSHRSRQTPNQANSHIDPSPTPATLHNSNADHLLLPLPELLGMLSAHQWRIRGINVPAIGTTIHPHYGVFAPTRQDYVDLAAVVPWQPVTTAFDIGTGTGVLAILLAQRGATHVVATDIQSRAVACARDNVRRLGMDSRVRVEHRDMFPDGRADLIVCNPPWLPAEPTSSLEAGVYDPGAGMLRRLIQEIPHHLTPGGEAWLILSDLAERLGLRPEVTSLFTDAGLVVTDRYDARRRTRKLGEEVVSLWRLG